MVLLQFQRRRDPDCRFLQHLYHRPQYGLHGYRRHLTPSAPLNSSHVTFYQTTLVNFVETPFDPSAAAADFAGASGLSLGATLHLRPEIDLVNPSSGINNGNITVASNWNLGAGTFTGGGTYVPYYRTTGAADAGEPGVLTLRAINNVQINATITDGFYETNDPFGGSGLVANTIANNPQMNGAIADYNTTSAANLMSIVAGINNGSFSYDFVSGAAFSPTLPAVDPDAVAAVPAGTVTTGLNPSDGITINGHTSYPSANSTVYLGNSNAIYGNYDTVYQTIDIPTLLRTGTGSITLTAAGSFELLDTTAPGVVYTAGAATTTLPANCVPPVLPANTGGTSSNGLVSTLTWAISGGAVTINAGASIVGIEAPVDDINGSQTFVAGGLTGEFWTAWYYRAGQTTGGSIPFNSAWQSGYWNYVSNLPAQQNTTWINYGTFFQGVGALGGGNVTLKAGGISTTSPCRCRKRFRSAVGDRWRDRCRLQTITAAAISA
jgi:hypothetical protein